MDAECGVCRRYLPSEAGVRICSDDRPLPCAHVSKNGSQCAIGSAPRQSQTSRDEIWNDDSWWDL